MFKEQKDFYNRCTDPKDLLHERSLRFDIVPKSTQQLSTTKRTGYCRYCGKQIADSSFVRTVDFVKHKEKLTRFEWQMDWHIKCLHAFDSARLVSMSDSSDKAT